MSIIIDMLYREYCRARLAEMRKQVLIPVASDKIPQTPSENCDPSDPTSQGSNWVTTVHPTIR